MTRTRSRPFAPLLVLAFSVLSASLVQAVPGWEEIRTPGGPASGWPEIAVFNSVPWLSFLQKKDGVTALNIFKYTNQSWRVELGPADSWQYGMVIDGEGRPFIDATAASNALRLCETTNGVFLTNRPGIPGMHSPRLYLNAATKTVFEFFTVISNERHRLFLNTFSLTDASRFPFAPVQVAPNLEGPAFQGLFFPTAAFASNRIFLLFVLRTEDGNRRTDTVWRTVSTNNGAEWSPAARLSADGRDAQYPSASVRSKRVLFSWLQSFSNREQRLVTLTSTNRGISFSAFTHTNFAFPAYFTETFLKPDGMHLAGYDYSRNQKSVVFHKIFDPATRTWSDPEWLSPTNRDAWNYTLGWNDSKTWIAWQNDRQSVQFTENDTFCPRPVVFSADIDTNWETSSTAPVIQWFEPADNSGIRSFAFILDNSPSSTPDIENLNGNVASKSLSDLSDGRMYFHIRSVDGKGNWSETSHFGFTVNSSPLATPVIASSTHAEFTPTSNPNPSFEWSLSGEKRKIAGYSYLLTQKRDREPDEKILTTKTSIGYKRLATGVWYFYVKAVDQNGLWSSYAVYTINIQETVIASDELEGKGKPSPESEGLLSEENESAVSYTLDRGEVLTMVIRKALGLREDEDANDYLKEIVRFNHIQDPDLMRQGDKILFPVVIVKENMDLARFAEMVFGSAKDSKKLEVIGKPGVDVVAIGDKVLIKDPYFLMTGRLKAAEERIEPEKTGEGPEIAPTSSSNAESGGTGVGNTNVQTPAHSTNTPP